MSIYDSFGSNLPSGTSNPPRTHRGWQDKVVETEIISASEAKRISEDVESAANKKQLAEVMVSIKAEAARSKRSLTRYDSLLKPVKKKLEDLGYIVTENSDQRDGNYHTISW